MSINADRGTWEIHVEIEEAPESSYANYAEVTFRREDGRIRRVEVVQGIVDQLHDARDEKSKRELLDHYLLREPGERLVGFSPDTLLAKEVSE